ncbi:DUF2971 domain-containing protein [Aminobacter sp. HY435]|uniref:DUF2971 domain-containing protein n=1 Tax=Aminobacter sp. HY435 TaxID=2970917 RepID=UPI0022B96CEA|nr:DUF2971 domain-containing protein [Aminobacter sp. HY435]
MDHDELLKVTPRSWANQRVHFFKYMSLGTARIVLSNTTLRWSTPGTLNDPYDIQFDLQLSVDRSRLRPMAVAKLWKVFKGKSVVSEANGLGQLIAYMGTQLPHYPRSEFEREFGEAIDEGFERMMAALPGVNAEVREKMADSKVLCLTTDPTSPPMWAHYADNNRGVVLRFRSIPAFDSAFGMAKPVDYVEELPKLLDEEFLAEMFAGRSSIDPVIAANRMVFTKGADWSYEKEWRIFSGAGRNKRAESEDLPFHTLELDGIIAGLRMPVADRKELEGLASRYSNVELMEACRSTSSLKHEIRTLS